MMMLGQEPGVLVAEIFVCLTLSDTLLIQSTFVARRRTDFHAWRFYYLLSILASTFDLHVLFLWLQIPPQKVYW